MLVFGTRPEAIKMAPVHRALLAESDIFDPLCCVTAQHRQMLDQTLSVFGIVPDIDLDLMRDGQGLPELSASVLTAMTAVLRRHAPDLVLVHGDTTTSMAAAMAAFYARIPVGHVEAGLRTSDLSSPFPEECNRRIVGMMARYHFAPTEAARTNLLREACDPASILVTGNTAVDALNAVMEDLESDTSRRDAIEAALARTSPFDWRSGTYVLVTCHRRETLERGIGEVCAALIELSAAFPGMHFVFPVHRNPKAREPVETLLSGHDTIHLIPPLSYDAFLIALRRCHFVLSDSGGIQEEAPSFGKPVLVMREVTERPEAITAGVAKLVGSRRAEIVAAASDLLANDAAHARMVANANPFGDGLAANRIANFLKQAWLSIREDKLVA